MSRRVYWRSQALWPGLTDAVPAGYRAVTYRARAEHRAADVMACLDPKRHSQFNALWSAALDEGFQPSGLLLVCLSALAPVLGHSSPTVPKRFGQFCLSHRLWCRVPGKLYPHPRVDAPGERCRAYVVLEPLAGMGGPQP